MTTPYRDSTEMLLAKLPEIQAWVQEKMRQNRTPFYSSVDMRHAGFKLAAVDTNLFPAGFNNLAESDHAHVVETLRAQLNRDVPGCQHLLLVTEEHTRNTWYLENIHVLATQLRATGVSVRLATFLDDDPAFCKEATQLVLPTASGASVTLECLHHVMKQVGSGAESLDAIVLNNDLSVGIPKILAGCQIPILTPIAAGWHSREKSGHFAHGNALVRELCTAVGLDPWLLSAYFVSVSQVDIHSEADRIRVATAAEALFDRIAIKYKQYGILEKPFVFMKADSGTYGMGIHVLESPDDIREINRKVRNKLHKGKQSQVIARYLLQEGVPTVLQQQQHTAEPCFYHVGGTCVGAFWRFNTERGNRENLNASGMQFLPIAALARQTPEMQLLQTISQLAVLAAGAELTWLK